MYRIVNKHVTTVALFALCDDRGCSSYSSFALPERTELTDALQAGYLQNLTAQGWLIRMNVHLCPMCAKNETASRAMVQLVGSMPRAPRDN